MTASWRAITLLAATAWRADRRLTLAVAAEPLGNTLGLLAGLWLAALTTGTIEHDTTLLALGVTGLVTGAGLGWQLDLSSSQWRMLLSEKMTYAFEIENAQLAAVLPGLDHHERPEYQAKLELLRQRQGQLGDAMSTLAMAYKAVSGGLVVLVLLVLAHPLLLGLVALALPAVVIARYEQRWRQAAEEAAALPGRTARYLRTLAYDRDAGMEVRVFGLAAELEDRAAQAWAQYRRPLERAERRVALVTCARDGLMVAGIVTAVGFELWQVVNGRATPGEAILVVYVSRQVQSAVTWPVQAVGSVGQTLRTAARLQWLRGYAASVAARYAGGQPAPAALAGGIEFDNVSFRYPGTDTWVLREVSMTLPAGSVLAVVGENGAGKTTLVKLLARMYEPTTGRILVDGVDLAEIDIASWRQRLSAAFQDFARLEFTAQHTVGAGDLARLDDEGHVLGALERAGAVDVLSALPDGAATQLGAQWDGVDLSTGQWQKLALGRALMRTQPVMVFFDEPTAALDAPSEHALFERYAAASRDGTERGMITILVSHRFSTVSAADRVLVLAGQQVAEYGTHDELVAAGHLYAELYDLQARSYQS